MKLSLPNATARHIILAVASNLAGAVIARLLNRPRPETEPRK